MSGDLILSAEVGATGPLIANYAIIALEQINGPFFSNQL